MISTRDETRIIKVFYGISLRSKFLSSFKESVTCSRRGILCECDEVSALSEVNKTEKKSMYRV